MKKFVYLILITAIAYTAYVLCRQQLPAESTESLRISIPLSEITDPDQQLEGLKRILRMKVSNVDRILIQSTKSWNIDKNGIRLLLNEGANINHQDNLGRTPLMWSIINHNMPVFKLLLKNGADINIRDNNGVNALDIALQKGFSEMALFLEPENISSRIVGVKH